MMSILEHDLVERFKKLDVATQQRLLSQVEELPAPKFNFADWLQRVESFEKRLAPAVPFMSAEDIIRQIREGYDEDTSGS
jgi:hypothetical protein